MRKHWREYVVEYNSSSQAHVEKIPEQAYKTVLQRYTIKSVYARTCDGMKEMADSDILTRSNQEEKSSNH